MMQRHVLVKGCGKPPPASATTTTPNNNGNGPRYQDTKEMLSDSADGSPELAPRADV